MTVYPLTVNMTRGELSPYLHARADTEHYAAGLKKAESVVCLRYGGFTRTPGSVYGGPTKDSSKASHFFPFKFNRTQVYAIEAGDLYFRFWVMGAIAPERIESGGSPVEVVTPYTETDVQNIRVRQVADVVYIVCDGFQTRTLTRNSETSWTLALYEALDGPYLKVNTTSTTLTPADYAAISPKMTSNTAPSGTVSSSTGAANAYVAFDKDPSTSVQIVGTTGWLRYQQAAAAQVIADAYFLRAAAGVNAATTTPVGWRFQGSNDGVNWTTLDTRQAEVGWVAGEVRFYEFKNLSAFEYYQIDWDGVDGGVNTNIGEFGVHLAIEDQTAFNLTASAATGINDDTGFQTIDVGRAIRLLGSDGVWRWAKIISRTSTTVVTVKLYNHALPDLSPIINWKLGAFSEETGWPKAIGIYEDRLVTGGTTDDPVGFHASVNSAYDNYRVSAPLVDDDAISARLTGGDLNEIQWIAEGKDILIGTAGSLRAVGRNDAAAAFSPSNIRQRTETFVGAADAEPVLHEDTIVFIDDNNTRYYEAAYTYEVDGYRARELTKLNEHMLQNGVEEIKYQSHPHRLIWGRRTDGKMLASVYDKEEQVFGTTITDFGGVVESILTLPGTRRTDLFMIVKRTINGATVRNVEALSEFYREEHSQQGVPIYADCAAVYDGAATTGLTGLGYLEGKTVGILADGKDIGDAVVTAGAITFPHSISASLVVVGLRRNTDVRTLRLNQIGNKDGSGLGRKVTIVEAFIDLLETHGLTVGSASAQDELIFEEETVLDPFAAPTMKTGMYSLPVEDSWANNGELIITGDRMYPATVRAIMLNVDGEP